MRRKERKRPKMSATVDYQVVIDRLTDAIKELNRRPCAGETAVLPPERPEERRADLRADTAALLKQLHGTLDQAAAHAADAHAEHEGASAQSKVRSVDSVNCDVVLPNNDCVRITIPFDMKVSELIPKITREVKFLKVVISDNPKILTRTGRQILFNIHSNSTFLSSYFPTLSPSSKLIELYIRKL